MADRYELRHEKQGMAFYYAFDTQDNFRLTTQTVVDRLNAAERLACRIESSIADVEKAEAGLAAAKALNKSYRKEIENLLNGSDGRLALKSDS